MGLSSMSPCRPINLALTGRCVIISATHSCSTAQSRTNVAESALVLVLATIELDRCDIAVGAADGDDKIVGASGIYYIGR